MGGVGNEFGFLSAFGDWKSTPKLSKRFGTEQNKAPRNRAGQLIPDYAPLSEPDGEPLIVGEGKTPWKRDFNEWWKRYITYLEDGSDDPEAAGHFSQVVGRYPWV